MNIGYIVPAFDDTTGWGRWANDFLRYAQKFGITPYIWAPHSSKKHFFEQSYIIESFFHLPELFDFIQSRKGIATIPKIISFCKKNQDFSPRLDLIHSFEAYPWGIYGSYLADKKKIPHVITSHGRYGYIAHYRISDQFVYRRILKKAAKIITVSDAVKNEILKHFSDLIDESPIQTLLNPIDNESFPTAITHKPKANDRPLIISVTRFIACKDIETSIKAFQIIKNKIPGARYVIIGPGKGPENPYYQNVLKQIEEYQLQGVEIIGRVNKKELIEYYKKADLLLHTPKTLVDDFEAYGLILLEAALFGLPVVATQSGGIPEIIADGKNGLLAPEEDHQRLAELSIRILKNPSLADKLGNANKDMALERNWKWYFKKQVQIYEQLI